MNVKSYLSNRLTLQTIFSSGFTIYYPDVAANASVVPYPWTIALVQGNNAAVSDIELLNSYNGISAVGAARHYLARIQGQPTNMGIFIDQTYDIGRIEDVHFNPWFENSAPYYDWQYLHGIAFSIARSDWEYVFNTFAFGYAIGYQFIESTTGSCNGNFVGIGADGILNNSVVVESADPWGIDIVNGEFTAFQVYKDLPFNAPAQIVSLPSNGGVVSFTSCAFWGPAQNIARLDGKPAGGTRFDFLKFCPHPIESFISLTPSTQLESHLTIASSISGHI